MIGVYDSGLGGLTALVELRRYRPDLDIHYYADTAHLPYGARSPDDLERLATDAISYLIRRGADAVLIACGTVSSVVLPKIAPRFSVPLVGVVESAAEAAIRVTMSQCIGIIATEATVRSRTFERSLREKARVATHSVACPLFVPLAENGFTGRNDPIASAAVAHYLSSFKNTDVDTLILGCTHFSHLAAPIAAYLPHVRLIGTGEAAADALIATRPRVGHGRLTIEVSDAPETFGRGAEKLLGAPLPCRVTRRQENKKAMPNIHTAWER